MKKLIFSVLACVGLFGMVSCTDELDIKQDYAYHVETLPLPKKLAKGETIALEFSIIREGYYNGTTYKFRYFQLEGEGLLSDSTGKIIPMNRFQTIPNDNFILNYQSAGIERQTLDFVFENNFGQRVKYKIEFENK